MDCYHRGLIRLSNIERPEGGQEPRSGPRSSETLDTSPALLLLQDPAELGRAAQPGRRRPHAGRGVPALLLEEEAEWAEEGDETGGSGGDERRERALSCCCSLRASSSLPGRLACTRKKRAALLLALPCSAYSAAAPLSPFPSVAILSCPI